MNFGSFYLSVGCSFTREFSQKSEPAKRTKKKETKQAFLRQKRTPESKKNKKLRLNFTITGSLMLI